MPQSTAPVLETARLVLRPFALADTAALHEALSDRIAMRYWDALPADDLDTTAQNVVWLMKYSPYAHAAWAIEARSDRRLLGLVNYHHREARHHRLEIGYLLLPRFWGQGFAAEAVSRMLRHCFADMRVHRAEAMIEPENLASIRLVERLGFRREGGPLRDRLRVGPSWRSVLVYGLVDAEFRPFGEAS